MGLTEEEQKHIDELCANIKIRKLTIELNEWKQAYEKLARYIINNFNNTSVFVFTQKVSEFRPSKK